MSPDKLVKSIFKHTPTRSRIDPLSLAACWLVQLKAVRQFLPVYLQHRLPELFPRPRLQMSCCVFSGGFSGGAEEEEGSLPPTVVRGLTPPPPHVTELTALPHYCLCSQQDSIGASERESWCFVVDLLSPVEDQIFQTFSWSFITRNPPPIPKRGNKRSPSMGVGIFQEVLEICVYTDMEFYLLIKLLNPHPSLCTLNKRLYAIKWHS